MAFDIEALKDALGTNYDSLKTHLETLERERDQARDGNGRLRGSLQAQLDQATKDRDEAKNLLAQTFEKLGIEDQEGLDALPNAKGQAEANTQLAARLKRLERENGEYQSSLGQAKSRIQTMERDAVISSAMGGHHWADGVKDIAQAYLQANIEREGDTWMMKGASGLVELKAGMADFVKERPALVQSSGQPGSGFSAKKGYQRKPLSEMTTGEKTEFYNEVGAQGYEAAKAAESQH